MQGLIDLYGSLDLHQTVEFIPFIYICGFVVSQQMAQLKLEMIFIYCTVGILWHAHNLYLMLHIRTQQKVIINQAVFGGIIFFLFCLMKQAENYKDESVQILVVVDIALNLSQMIFFARLIKYIRPINLSNQFLVKNMQNFNLQLMC